MLRRTFLSMTALASAGAACHMTTRTRADRAKRKPSALSYGRERPFDFSMLERRAKALAARPYQETPIRSAEWLDKLDYDAYQQIRFRPEASLFGDLPKGFAVQFFHLGRHAKQPVRVHVLSNGRAREVRYSPELFEYGKSAALARRLPTNVGFAGFRVMHDDGSPRDWLAFSGASYFRSSGELDQYGLSVRGVAVNTGLPKPEEFPRFTEFWLEQSGRDDRITIYALLDGPSVSGAYRIVASRSGRVLMDVDSTLFMRNAVERLGIAPLTSMFWFAEHNRKQATDWRPEVHDSDALALWRGNGERVLRPLNNPPGVMTNSFVDENPKGFGLVQRDRSFANYEDDGVFYERRPTVWVEPKGPWGKGAVQLVEIPTDDEVFDNIVAYWVPDKGTTRGAELSHGYRLHWTAKEPFLPTNIGHVVSTRIGRGGVPGQPRPKDAVKFVVDFEGGPLGQTPKGANVAPVVSASSGSTTNRYALRVVGTDRWRAFFDLKPEGDRPIDLRLYLRLGERALTETWVFQHLPTR